MSRIFNGILLTIVLAPVSSANERTEQLTKLTAQWQQEHDTLESLNRDYKSVLDKFRDLQKKHASLEAQIGKHQDQIRQAQQRQKTGGKKNNQNDPRLDQQVRADREAIEKLSREQSAIAKEGREVEGRGRELARKVENQAATLWNWRNSWADAADIDLSSAKAEHENTLGDLPRQGKAGPLANAWLLARSIAQAGAGRPNEALETLEPLIKDEIWRGKASSLKAYLLWKTGESTKSAGEFGRALQLDNRDPHYYLLRGIVDVQAGKLADARRLFDRAEDLKVSAARTAAWRSLAYSQEEKPSPGEIKAAIEFAELAINKQRDWIAHDALAAAHAAAGEFQKAAAEQKTALKLAPQEQHAACETRLKSYASGKRATYEWK